MMLQKRRIKNEIIMKNIWEKLKELYDQNPTLFGILLFIDLTILYFIIQYIIS
ncbi:MAG: Uncharacterised protein [Cryomorphaceae bacterium]|nr:MAG: Uncharacterised protein [Cryomorphaceae bacterium]